MSGAQHISPEKHDKCVKAAQTALYTNAVGSAAFFAGAWYGAGMAFPKVAAINWRIKAVTSCVSVIAYSYYRGERALIDCTQEYAERAHEKELRERRKRAEREATEKH